MTAHNGRFGQFWRRLGPALAAFLLAMLALFGSPVSAQTFPKFTGLVTDAAGVLPADQKAALEAKLEGLQQRTNRQLVVATIPDLQGYEIADYGYRLGRAWGVGLKGADNGAILIVAPKDRKVRVEVGYGLEPVLTDALSSVIIQTRIIPAFKAGDMSGGITAGADALIEQLSLPDDQAKAKVAEAVKAYDAAHKRRNGQGAAPIAVIFWLVIIGGIIVVAGLRRSTRGVAYRQSGSNWPVWLWAASEIVDDLSRSNHRGGGGSWGGGFGGDSGGSDGSWGGGGFTGGGGGSFGGGGASGSW